jgi:hypothetical protein
MQGGVCTLARRVACSQGMQCRSDHKSSSFLADACPLCQKHLDGLPARHVHAAVIVTMTTCPHPRHCPHTCIRALHASSSSPCAPPHSSHLTVSPTSSDTPAGTSLPSWCLSRMTAPARSDRGPLRTVKDRHAHAQNRDVGPAVRMSRLSSQGLQQQQQHGRVLLLVRYKPTT